MARKLNSQEETLFAKAWASDHRLPDEEADQWLRERLSRQRDTALSLSPELGMWLAAEPGTRSNS